MYAGFVSIMALISTSLEKSAPARSSEICSFSCWGLFPFSLFRTLGRNDEHFSYFLLTVSIDFQADR